jgi:prevent-host-death family protein
MDGRLGPEPLRSQGELTSPVQVPRARTRSSSLSFEEAVDPTTTRGYRQVMTKVGIADLKAHLSHYLRKVRAGRTLTVLDRDTPVARIVPIDADAPLQMRRATRKPSDLRPSPPCPAPTDSLSVLLRDRQSR